MKNRFLPLLVLAVAAGLVVPACSTNTQGDEATSVFFTVSYDGIPVATNVGAGAPLQIQTATIRSIYKVPPTGSTPFLDARIDDYVVEWQRLDGGQTVSAPEVFGGYAVVPAGGTLTLTNNVFMSPSQMLRSPLDQLLPYNGGIDRETGRSEIRMKAKVTYRGRLMTGDAFTAVGGFDMMFVYSSGTAARAGK